MYFLFVFEHLSFCTFFCELGTMILPATISALDLSTLLTNVWSFHSSERKYSWSISSTLYLKIFQKINLSSTYVNISILHINPTISIFWWNYNSLTLPILMLGEEVATADHFLSLETLNIMAQ